ncbi:SpoIIE family protein phosphatase [Candidatus Manganitrophus noduliformans]|uniref:SpoIIE family protein phosphatase n=1 Tax=Candidatus Manganitrophus noduliformans TaxID=2606439 RepID=A0A7X6IC17_9BACT|nr:SpoIIE family protein phosphatase [Candidatus Manganitrophus noduliformans]NKE72218.1 SpoIIE family protein phosphatase [Candidatus Manganitrophus noduliformans]
MALKATELCVIVPEGAAWAGEIRRRLVRLAESVGFSEEKCSDVALVATEMATNLEKHRAVLPVIRYGVTESDLRGRSLLMISEDRGPGIPHPEQALRDHYSTAGTLGGGLGAIRRLSDDFAIYSETTRPRGGFPGTVVVSRIWSNGPSSDNLFDCEALTRPKPGEIDNGDGVWFGQSGDSLQVAVIDGLGHGLGAKKAAQAAREGLNGTGRLPLDAVLDRLHRALQRTQGAVVGILRIDLKEGRAVYAGVGNIDCRIYGPHPARPISMNGSLGVVTPRFREESFPFEKGDVFVLTSDGISTKWDPADYGKSASASPLLLGSLLLRDHSRPKDDATVVVGRIG